MKDSLVLKAIGILLIITLSAFVGNWAGKLFFPYEGKGYTSEGGQKPPISASKGRYCYRSYVGGSYVCPFVRERFRRVYV